MSTLLLLLAALLICAVIAGGVIWRRLLLPASLPDNQTFSEARSRKLTIDERDAVEDYIETLNRTQGRIGASGASTAPVRLELNARSQQVFSLTRSITRYGLSSDELNKWHYYLDSLEVHLPLFWDQFITNDNQVELIYTETMPLVIALNGQTLNSYHQESKGLVLQPLPAGQASIRGEESEQTEQLHLRAETPEEHLLEHSAGLLEALLICLAFVMLFLCLVVPGMVLPWLLCCTLLLLAGSVWGLFSPPAKKDLREVHCLRGTPRRWGLFGESNKEPIDNISLGIIDLIYPSHWKPYVVRDLGHKTNIDIYLNRRVVRQGRFLSLHDEVKKFPLKHWIRNLIMATGALIVLIMLFLWVPLEMPLRLTVSWIKGAQVIDVNSIEQLTKTKLQVGDTLRVKGTGTCNIQITDNIIAQQNPSFTPFDCSQIIWNTPHPLALPASMVMERAAALTQIVNRQTHPQTVGDAKVNPQLQMAIQQSGMVLLDDFAGIVAKTQELCTATTECIRLKNALVNLSNTKDWETLTRSVNAGRYNDINILLRPVSAESFDNLVTSATTPFFISETSRAARALYEPGTGGFILISDEGSNLVDHPLPVAPLYNYPPQKQWQELTRLATMLLQTPFHAEGIITHLSNDKNQRLAITLHHIPDNSSLWRYVCTTLLLIGMIICLLVNTIIALRRYREQRHRLTDIHRYYDNCLNSFLLPAPTERPVL